MTWEVFDLRKFAIFLQFNFVLKMLMIEYISLRFWFHSSRTLSNIKVWAAAADALLCLNFAWRDRFFITKKALLAWEQNMNRLAQCVILFLQLRGALRITGSHRKLLVKNFLRRCSHQIVIMMMFRVDRWALHRSSGSGASFKDLDHRSHPLTLTEHLLHVLLRSQAEKMQLSCRSRLLLELLVSLLHYLALSQSLSLIKRLLTVWPTGGQVCDELRLLSCYRCLLLCQLFYTVNVILLNRLLAHQTVW